MANPENLQVLTALDKAKTQWYHFTAIVIAGMGFFTDAYDLFCISTVTKLLGRLYYFDASTGKPGILPAVVNSSVTGVALVGTLLGQLFFGWLGDKLGRKKVYGMTLMLMICSSIASGFSFGSTPKAVMISLCFFRFWLGFGIGGDYPLSATIMSEYANTRTRGSFIAAVFAMQGFGILVGAAVAIIVSSTFMNAYPRKPFEQDPLGSTPPQADFVWRIILMLGAVPAALTYYWRMQMPETARFTALVAGDTRQAAKDMEKVLQVHIDTDEAPERKKLDQFGLFSREFLRRHGLHLQGTTSTWFLLDLAFYSSNLSQKDVLTAVGWLHPSKTMNAIEEVYVVARGQALIALCASIPGYWFTVALIDRIGRFAIQLQGFFFMTLFMFVLGIPYTYWRGHNCETSATKICMGHHPGFVIIYSLTFFFSNFGPNSTTFVVPAEIFPARLRATCHGISAAAGKAGAILGALGFQLLAQDPDMKYDDVGYNPGIGLQKSLLILGGCNGLGLLLTFLVPETKGKSLEELSGEDARSIECPKVPSIRATVPVDGDV